LTIAHCPLSLYLYRTVNLIPTTLLISNNLFFFKHKHFWSIQLNQTNTLHNTLSQTLNHTVKMVSSFRLIPVLALAFSALAVPLDKRYDGSGIILHNKGSGPQTFYFYENTDNGNGWADPSYGDAHLPNAPTIQAGDSTFVPLDKSFKGRVQRGTTIPATWAEFQLAASDDGKAHGDISVQQGNDGPVTLKSPTTGQVGGFENDLISDAPQEALAHNTGGDKPNGQMIMKDGNKALGSTMGNWAEKPNDATVQWYMSKGVDKSKVYFHNNVYAPSDSGTADIVSTNGQLEVTFF
jgi:hypothetical protein